MIDPLMIVQNGHLMAFAVDPERDLVRFACRFCGATTEPMVAGEPVPDSFHSLPHEDSCLVVAGLRAASPERRAA